MMTTVMLMGTVPGTGAELTMWETGAELTVWATGATPSVLGTSAAPPLVPGKEIVAPLVLENLPGTWCW